MNILENTIGIRKMKPKEMKQCAMVMAEAFEKYPLYDLFFGNQKNRVRRIFYFFWYRLYTRKNFTYVTDDLNMVCCIQTPEDKLKSPVGLFFNPAFFFGFIKNIRIKTLKLVREYSKIDKECMKKYYNPQEDWFVQALGIRKCERGRNLFFDFIRAMDNGKPIFCLTHSARNVRLYEYFGANVVDQVPFHDTIQYVLRREATNIPLSKRK